MNRIKILVAFCIIIPIQSFSDSLDSQRCLDYAGIEYLLEHGDPYNGIGSRCQNGLTIKEFLSTPELSMSTDSTMLFAKNWLNPFHYMIVQAEANALGGNYIQFEKTANALLGLLLWSSKNMDVVGNGIWRRGHLKALYMYARLINKQTLLSHELPACVIRDFLPRLDDLGNEADKFFVKRYNTFRNMLLIGAELELYRKKNNKLPQILSVLKSIDEDELVDAWNRRIDYKYDKMKWKLYSSGKSSSFDDGNVELFIPAVEKVSGMYTDEIWFASEYSNRRKQLYEGVHINTNTIYSCYLKGGIIRRKRD